MYSFCKIFFIKSSNSSLTNSLWFTEKSHSGVLLTSWSLATISLRWGCYCLLLSKFLLPYTLESIQIPLMVPFQKVLTKWYNGTLITLKKLKSLLNIFEFFIVVELAILWIFEISKKFKVKQCTRFHFCFDVSIYVTWLNYLVV